MSSCIRACCSGPVVVGRIVLEMGSVEAPLLLPAPSVEGCPGCVMEWRKANSKGRVPYMELFFVGVTSLASCTYVCQTDPYQLHYSMISITTCFCVLCSHLYRTQHNALVTHSIARIWSRSTCVPLKPALHCVLNSFRSVVWECLCSSVRSSCYRPIGDERRRRQADWNMNLDSVSSRLDRARCSLVVVYLLLSLDPPPVA